MQPFGSFLQPFGSFLQPFGSFLQPFGVFLQSFGTYLHPSNSWPLSATFRLSSETFWPEIIRQSSETFWQSSEIFRHLSAPRCHLSTFEKRFLLIFFLSKVFRQNYSKIVVGYFLLVRDIRSCNSVPWCQYLCSFLFQFSSLQHWLKRAIC